MNPKLFALVKTIIDEWDPAELLAIHCPSDEYHSEIREITIYIEQQETISENELGYYIYKIFNDYLGDQFQETKEKSIEISRRIINEIHDKTYFS
ncbi:hypothetical protein [Paenibacillus sp. Z6-24]